MLAAVAFLLVPSAIVFALLAFHAIRNRGGRTALVYFGAAAVYGIARAAALRKLVESQEGTLLPYLMALPGLRLGPASLQEILGWGIAATLAWALADRLLRRLGKRPGPHRTAALAAPVLTLICFAVETAAIGAGWWVWTIKQPSRDLLGRVPLVGLLDWTFVAFDFLLPYLLLAGPASALDRILGLSLFPLHFLGHSQMDPLPVVSLSPNDLAHAGIAAYVLSRAVGETAGSGLPDPGQEKHAWVPPLAVALVSVSTALASLIVARKPWACGASLPLLLATGMAFIGPSGAAPAKEKPSRGPSPQPSWPSRVSLIVVALGLTYLIRAPFYARTQVFVESMRRGVERLNAGDARGAEQAVRMGLEARPDQASGRTILAQVLLRQGRRAEAREQLGVALDLFPTHRDTLILLTTLDLIEHRWQDAAGRAALGRRLYPDRPEFLYQETVAARRGAPGEPASEAVSAARRAGRWALDSLRSLALSLGDPATAAACGPP